MKSTIILVIICLQLNISCRKEKEQLNGQWRWITTYQGGFIGHTIVPDANAIVTLSLEANATYITYLNNQVSHQGKYTITTAADDISTIHFDEDITTDKLIMEKDEAIYYQGEDTLNMSDGQAIGDYHSFTKIK